VGFGAPNELTASLNGRVWKRAIGKGELQGYRQKYSVISTRLVAGQTVVHVVANSDPGDGFVSVEAGLEDVYFSTLTSARQAA
jgi:hypothetical protein